MISLAVCANGRDVLIPSAYSKMPMGGDVRKFIRSLMAVSRSTDVKTTSQRSFIDPCRTRHPGNDQTILFWTKMCALFRNLRIYDYDDVNLTL